MFLTTEPTFPGTPYTVLRIVFTVGVGYAGIALSAAPVAQAYQAAVVQALAQLEQEGLRLQADAVVGIRISTSQMNAVSLATLIGTAVKFHTPR